jgi:hypothetical protein
LALDVLSVTKKFCDIIITYSSRKSIFETQKPAIVRRGQISSGFDDQGIEPAPEIFAVMPMTDVDGQTTSSYPK